jgi:signal transduction histidine kinase
MGVLPYEGEQFNGSVGVLRDVTEKKKRRQKLERQNERLEEFASVVSHDLRNPLQVAYGRLGMVQEDCDSEHIDHVMQALDRMDRLIENVLKLAREGNEIGETEPVVLADVTKDCWQNIATPEAELIIDSDREIQTDRSRLQQLLENLLGNAIEHGDSDVTVSVGVMEDGFYVADTGPGIPEGDRESAFEAGYSTSEEGVGFGLRIAEQIADSHGWEIGVTESEQGGARFEFTDVEFVDM